MTTTSYSIAGSLFLIVILLALFVVVPILIGIYVYRDARRRGMNAILWTVLCVLIPAFVGLIVYLIVRSDHTAYVCAKCGKPVREQFVRCPYCGASLKELCKSCGQPLEAGWKLCPACGTEIAPEQEAAMQARHPKDRGLGGILAVAILVPVLLCVLLMLGVLSFRTSGSLSTSSATWIESMTVEDIQDLSASVDVKAWIEACDEASREGYGEDGTGMNVYVLRATEEGSENTTTRYLVYRNDGYRIVSAETEEKGWRNSARELVLEYTEAEEDDLGYDLLYYEITSDKTYSLAIYSDSESTAYSIEDVDELVIRYGGLTIDVTVGKDAGNVASVACTFYVEDEVWQTDVTESTHGDSLTNTSLSFYYETPIHDGITSFYLEFYDEDENLLLGKLVELDAEEDEESEGAGEGNADEMTTEGGTEINASTGEEGTAVGAEMDKNDVEERTDIGEEKDENGAGEEIDIESETEKSVIEAIDESGASDVGSGQTWMFWVSADDNGNLVLRQLQ